jgi:hypothetical protein
MTKLIARFLRFFRKKHTAVSADKVMLKDNSVVLWAEAYPDRWHSGTFFRDPESGLWTLCSHKAAYRPFDRGEKIRDALVIRRVFTVNSKSFERAMLWLLRSNQDIEKNHYRSLTVERLSLLPPRVKEAVVACMVAREMGELNDQEINLRVENEKTFPPVKEA